MKELPLATKDEVRIWFAARRWKDVQRATAMEGVIRRIREKFDDKSAPLVIRELGVRGNGPELSIGMSPSGIEGDMAMGRMKLLARALRALADFVEPLDEPEEEGKPKS